MKNLKESEKNFLTCAILIALVGIALVFLDQTTLGILSIIAAGVFVGEGLGDTQALTGGLHLRP